MKLFLVCLVVVLCIFSGVLIRNHYKKRFIFYSDLVKFCETLTNDISFKDEKLNLVIENNIVEYKSDFDLFMLLFKKYLKHEISSEQFSDRAEKNLYFLSGKERVEVVNFFLGLGGSTKQEELNRIINFIDSSKILKKITKEEDTKFSSTYLKLFIALGIMLAIVFI